jgi:hypothetical protein
VLDTLLGIPLVADAYDDPLTPWTIRSPVEQEGRDVKQTSCPGHCAVVTPGQFAPAGHDVRRPFPLALRVANPGFGDTPDRSGVAPGERGRATTFPVPAVPASFSFPPCADPAVKIPLPSCDLPTSLPEAERRWGFA